MDLIYANKNGKEIDILKNYELDVAFGSDENDFRLSINLDDHCCQEGYFIYIDGTEYGGIVDKVEIDTDANVISYEGRTWHGILAGKVLEPYAGQDYMRVSGEANHVIANLINLIGLQNLFEVSNTDSGIYVDYTFSRYINAYHGILDMLFECNGKLDISHKNKKVILSAVWLYDYASDEEWDSSQFGFLLKKNYRPTNHLICLGSGELSDRKIIHLFADENGGIMPYAKVIKPVKDSDYILTKEKQRLFGVDEKTDTFILNNSQVTENYVLLPSLPAEWSVSYVNYFIFNEGKYEKLERKYITVYPLLSSQPDDWQGNYVEYFIRNESGYERVKAVQNERYERISSEPADWNEKFEEYYTNENNLYNHVKPVNKVDYIQLSIVDLAVVVACWDKLYSNYYYYYSDGVTTEYRSFQGVSKTRYNLQTQQPSDWNSSYGNYYKQVKVYRYKYTEKIKNDKK